MKRNFILLFTVLFVACGIFVSQKANADSVDVFVPSTGQKINPSPIARHLENSAQKAYNNKNSSSSSNRNNSNNSYNNSYNNGGYNSYNRSTGYNNGYDNNNSKNKSNGKNVKNNTKQQLPKSEWT